MKTRILLITSILSTGIALAFTLPSYAAENITTETVKTTTSPLTMTDPRAAASSFVEHINYARVALAMKNKDIAKEHIAQARAMVAIIKGATVEQRRITQVESGRIVYQYETSYKYHYFPIQTGPVQVKQMSNGPVWAKNDLAVTDADIVYLTLDLTGQTAETTLNTVVPLIDSGEFKEADNQLAKLTDEIVKVDSKFSVPGDKARDNIALARSFLAEKNYDGARFALAHADEGLDELQKNDLYKAHEADIIAMRKNVSDMQVVISKKDPTMLEKADSTLGTWWQELKGWSKSEK